MTHAPPRTRRTRAGPSSDASVLIRDFLGSAHVFSTTVREVVEERLLREIAGERITFAQYTLLRLVSLANDHNLRHVARFLGVSEAAASKAVDKLVRGGLLRRAEDTQDRRSIQLSLTQDGERLVAAYQVAQRIRMSSVLRSIPAAELRKTANLLDRVSAILMDRDAEPDQLCLRCGIYVRDRCLVRRIMKRDCFYVHHGNERVVGAPSRTPDTD